MFLRVLLDVVFRLEDDSRDADVTRLNVLNKRIASVVVEDVFCMVNWSAVFNCYQHGDSDVRRVHPWRYDHDTFIVAESRTVITAGIQHWERIV